jgi:DNA replication protein DnaC
MEQQTAQLSRPTECGCRNGLIEPPKLTGDQPMVDERTEQYKAGLLVFCDCHLGQGAQLFYSKRAQNPYGKQLAEAARLRRLAGLEKIDGLKPSERTLSLADYKVGPHNRRAADAVAAGIEKGYGLITLWGPFGVGKTALMMSAVNAVRTNDRTAIYRTTADMLAWLRAGFDQSQRDGEDFSYDKRWQLLTTVRCLALDEMTAFSVTPWAAERFERLIDERWRSMRDLLTICAFNAADEPEEGNCGLPGVVESRLRDVRAQWINVGGRDMRQVRR